MVRSHQQLEVIKLSTTKIPDKQKTNWQQHYVTQYNVFPLRLHAMGIVQKKENWMPHKLKKRDIEKRKTISELLMQRQKRKRFINIELLLPMKSGFTTRIQNSKQHGFSQVNRVYQRPSETCMVARLYGEIWRVWFIMSDHRKP